MALRGTRWFGKLTAFSDFVTRYSAVMISWKHVEAGFAQYYGLSLHDIWTMSWRRFVVLFDGLYPRPEKDETSNKFDVIEDWNTLAGRPRPDQVLKPIGIDEYMASQGSS